MAAGTGSGVCRFAAGFVGDAGLLGVRGLPVVDLVAGDLWEGGTSAALFIRGLSSSESESGASASKEVRSVTGRCRHGPCLFPFLRGVPHPFWPSLPQLFVSSCVCKSLTLSKEVLTLVKILGRLCKQVF